MKYFLGLELARSSTGIFLNQRKYTLNNLVDTGLSGVKSSVVPIEQNHKWIDNEFILLSPDDIAIYRRLLYLTITRPDLSYGVHVLSQFIFTPRVDHLAAAFTMVKYVKRTIVQ